MTEPDLLRALLLFSIAVAPAGAYRLLFAAPSQGRRVALWVALACTAAGLWGPFPALCFAWPLFCVGAFAQYLWQHRADLSSARGIATCVPFVFSIIAATWLVGGANELRLLGYGLSFSYYAALHGNVLGWMILSALAALAREDSSSRPVYLVSVYVCLASFLMIAIGIDQLDALKPIGVVGLTLALLTSHLAFLRSAWTRHKLAFVLGCASFLGLAFTLTLAWRHELGLPSLPPALNVRSMVSVHGVLNTLVVAPSLMLAVLVHKD